MVDPINTTNFTLQLLTNFSSMNQTVIPSMTAENLITQYCFVMKRNNMWFLGALVFLWQSKWMWKTWMKYHYTKKNRVIPPKMQSAFDFLVEELDFFQSTYILIVFVLCFY